MWPDAIWDRWAADVQALLDDIPRPVGYDLSVAGKFEEQQKAFRELVISLVLALVLVYMVLACQYESLRDPLVVMFSVPLAIIGVLVTLFLTGTTLNVQSYIGCIMLGRHRGEQRHPPGGSSRAPDRGRPPHPRSPHGSRPGARLRPILMTTLTTNPGVACPWRWASVKAPTPRPRWHAPWVGGPHRFHPDNAGSHSGGLFPLSSP